MELNVNIAGEELSAPSAARQLRLIADMIKKGVTMAHGANIEYLGSFSFEVDFEAEEHRDYWDGEHNHIHVNDEGIVVFRRGNDKEDGTEDFEELLDKNITVSEWGAAHGGITPWPEEEDEKDEKP